MISIQPKWVEKILNGEKTMQYSWQKINTKDIKEIDFGSYQGTLIFVFSNDVSQPGLGETYYTSVDYGSCSGCDTLQGISCSNYTWEFPTESQVNDYMTLCLHLLENTHSFRESYWNDDCL